MTELSIIIPVLNERDNIRPVVERLSATLNGIAWEVVFVDDDSDDGTADVCRALAYEDPRVRIIQRIGRRGLSSACVEGMMATFSPWVAVMDGDLQHDERVLPGMLATAREGDLDIVVASRNVSGGSMGEFSSARVWLSNAGRQLSSLIMKCKLTDPMSGFFLVSRPFLMEVVRDLSAVGFKILLDLIASSKRPVRLVEVPFTFRKRELGASKLSTSVGVDFLMLIADKLIGGILPVRFVLYLLVGLTGVLVHIAALAMLRAFMPQSDIVVHQVLATGVAILSNFLLNNEITFRDRKLKGWRALVRGGFWYTVACSLGAYANVSATGFLAGVALPWYLAAATGILISAVWNFGAASLLAWRIERRRLEHKQRSTVMQRLSTAPGR